MRIYQQVRISFTEPHILYMHQREFSDDAFKYAKLYKHIRNRETYNWLCKTQNCMSMDILHKKYPTYNIYKYVEPTRIILTETLNTIAQLYSSADAYDFFCFINSSVNQLANGRKDVSIYDSKLPADYYMEDDILCNVLLRICMSGAKGSNSALIDLVNQISSNDNENSKITPHVRKLDKAQFFSDMSNVNQVMANKSRDVQVNGHNFFKSNIGYCTVTFDNNQLCYNGTPVDADLNIVNDIILLPPTIANAILYCNEHRN